MIVEMEASENIHTTDAKWLRTIVFISFTIFLSTPFLIYWGHDIHKVFVEERYDEKFIIESVNNYKVTIKVEDGSKEERGLEYFGNTCPTKGDSYTRKGTTKGGLQFVIVCHLIICLVLSLIISSLLKWWYVKKFIMKPKHIVKGYIQ